MANLATEDAQKQRYDTDKTSQVNCSDKWKGISGEGRATTFALSESMNDQAKSWIDIESSEAATAQLEDSYLARASIEDIDSSSSNELWPQRSYPCTFCSRDFRTAQALGGHMNVHRRERAYFNQLGILRSPTTSQTAPQTAPPPALGVCWLYCVPSSINQSKPLPPLRPSSSPHLAASSLSSSFKCPSQASSSSALKFKRKLDAHEHVNETQISSIYNLKWESDFPCSDTDDRSSYIHYIATSSNNQDDGKLSTVEYQSSSHVDLELRLGSGQ